MFGIGHWEMLLAGLCMGGVMLAAIVVLIVLVSAQPRK
jgi:hypothetical protein